MHLNTARNSAPRLPLTEYRRCNCGVAQTNANLCRIWHKNRLKFEGLPWQPCSLTNQTLNMTLQKLLTVNQSFLRWNITFCVYANLETSLASLPAAWSPKLTTRAVAIFQTSRQLCFLPAEIVDWLSWRMRSDSGQQGSSDSERCWRLHFKQNNHSKPLKSICFGGFTLLSLGNLFIAHHAACVSRPFSPNWARRLYFYIRITNLLFY